MAVDYMVSPTPRARQRASFYFDDALASNPLSDVDSDDDIVPTVSRHPNTHSSSDSFIPLAPPLSRTCADLRRADVSHNQPRVVRGTTLRRRANSRLFLTSSHPLFNNPLQNLAGVDEGGRRDAWSVRLSPTSLSSQGMSKSRRYRY